MKQADVPVAERRLTVVDKYHSWNPQHALTKAYELMSCYQGLIEYYQVTGRKEYLDAAEKTAKNIAETEVARARPATTTAACTPTAATRTVRAAGSACSTARSRRRGTWRRSTSTLHAPPPHPVVRGGRVGEDQRQARGNVWRPDNRYRVWLPALIRGREY